MSLGRLVPWASWEEWRTVGNWLLSPEPADVQNGLERVAAWRARGRLPLGVDITACLVETRVRDHAALAPGAPATLPDSQLRLQYAMALVRMVNGIADSSQKGRVAASVASLAAAAGLPRILVDLRHEATHNELPSAASLRLAAEQALAWLEHNYWLRQGEHLAACREKVAGLVQEYVSLHAAAAAKVASHVDAESDDESALNAQQSSAAAAAAAVASGRRGTPTPSQPAGTTGVSSAMKAGGSAAAGAGAGAGAGEAAAGSGSGGYSAAAGQRRRKALLAELKMGVPRPAASLLVEPLLAAGASGATLAAAGGDAAALERALATALPHFLKEWPQLPGMLLRGAVHRLAACAAGGAEEGAQGAAAAAAAAQVPGQGPQEEEQQQQQRAQSLPPAAWLAWVARLLPAPSAATASASKQPAPTAGSVPRASELVPGWVPPAGLVRELIALILPALVRSTHWAGMEWIVSGGSSGGDAESNVHPGAAAAGAENATAAAVAAALQGALRLLLDSSRGAGSSAAGLARWAALLAQAQPGEQQQQGQRRGEGTGSAAATQGVSLGGDQSCGSSAGDELGRQQQMLTAAQEAVGALRAKRGGASQHHASSTKRWRRADGWAPCALGNLPSPSDPNGRPSPRESAPAAAEVTAAPAAVNAAAASERELDAVEPTAEEVVGPAALHAPPPSKQPLESSWERAVGTAATAGQAPPGDEEWPLDDGRLAWAAAAPSEVPNLLAAAPMQRLVVPLLELLL